MKNGTRPGLSAFSFASPALGGIFRGFARETKERNASREDKGKDKGRRIIMTKRPRLSVMVAKIAVAIERM